MKLEEKNYDRKQQQTHKQTHPQNTQDYVEKNSKQFEISNAREQIVIFKVNRHFFVSLMMAL